MNKENDLLDRLALLIGLFITVLVKYSPLVVAGITKDPQWLLGLLLTVVSPKLTDILDELRRTRRALDTRSSEIEMKETLDNRDARKEDMRGRGNLVMLIVALAILIGPFVFLYLR